MKNLFISLLISFTIFLGNFSYADSLTAVKNTTQETVETVMQLLQNKKMDATEKNNAIIKAVKHLFDFEKMAKLSLGKKYWKQMSVVQQTEFLELFVKKLQNSYLEKLSLYTDEKVVIKSVEHPSYKSGKKKGKPKKSRIVVVSALVKAGDEISMQYKFYKHKKSKQWQVYDFDVEGVSLIQTYRSQFKGVLAKQSIADFLKKLAKEQQS
jgi:phospholipid transport system substrate-binding protein